MGRDVGRQKVKKGEVRGIKAGKKRDKVRGRKRKGDGG